MILDYIENYEYVDDCAVVIRKKLRKCMHMPN